MNLYQLRTAVRDAMTAGGGNNVRPAFDYFWSDTAVNYYINFAQRKLHQDLKRARRKYFVRTLNSSDSALTIFKQTFTPSTLKMQNGVGEYTLPPDFMRMLLMTDLRTDAKARFRFSDLVKEEFRMIYDDTPTQVIGAFLCDIIAQRTLVVRPIPQDEFNVRYMYEKRLEPLRDYSAGLCTVAQNATSVSFTADVVMANIVAGMDLIVGVSTGQNASGSAVDPSWIYPQIDSVNSAARTATLKGPFVSADDVYAASRVFTVSGVSEIDSEYDDLLIAEAIIKGLSQGTNPHTDAALYWKGEVERLRADMVGDAEIRQEQDIETVEAYLEDEF